MGKIIHALALATKEFCLLLYAPSKSNAAVFYIAFISQEQEFALVAKAKFDLIHFHFLLMGIRKFANS
jgi:hypothetical protein